MRIKAGITMALLVLAILLSGNQILIFILMSTIQAKVFHEMRRVRLTIDNVHLEKEQIYYDWALFAVSFLYLVDVLWFASSLILFWFVIYTHLFAAWVVFILNKATSRSVLGQQIAHQSWVHLCILYTLTQPAIIKWNTAQGGLFWFIFPCSLVICNDSAAYFFGMYFGKTKLISLSPNKTAEGYFGALIVTVAFGYVASGLLSKFDCLIVDNHLDIYENIRFHGVVLALYASIFAPFSGFYASAIKRAADIKDFASWIPGHGGLTDRVDCQLFMAVFTYVYYNSITTS